MPIFRNTSYSFLYVLAYFLDALHIIGLVIRDHWLISPLSSLCLTVCLSVFLCLSVCLSVCLSPSVCALCMLSECLFMYILSFSASLCVFLSVSLRLSVCVSLYVVCVSLYVVCLTLSLWESVCLSLSVCLFVSPLKRALISCVTKLKWAPAR